MFIELKPDVPHAMPKIPFNIGAALLWPFWGLVHRVVQAIWVPVPILAWVLVKSIVIGPVAALVDLPPWVLALFGSRIVWDTLIAVPMLVFGVYADDLVWRRDFEKLDRAKYVLSQRWWAVGTLAYFILTAGVRLP